MASNKAYKRSIIPLLVMLILTVLAVCGYVATDLLKQNYTKKTRETLTEAYAEVDARNEAKLAAYNAENAEYQARLAERQQQESQANSQWPLPIGEGWEVVDLTNYPLENGYPETMTRQDTMYSGMLLVNEFHSRPDDFSESGLVGLSSYSGRQILVKDSTMKLFPDAAKALWDLVLAGRAAGYDNFVVYDSYRSWDAQNELFQKRLAAVKKDHPNYSDERLREVARRAVNEPGNSAYNTGNTFRINLYKKDDATVNNKVFFESDEGLWFLEHCWEYGIVFRFPLADYPVKGTNDKSYKTGVSTQLQTFTYVGKGNAAAMNALDMCMEEYIEYLMQHPHIAVFQNGTLKYEIYRQEVGYGGSFQVEKVGSRKVKSTVTSLDNMGYVISVFEY